MALTEDKIKNFPVMEDNTTAVAGKDTLVYIALDNAPTWLLLGGQRNNPLSRKADSIDATSKDSGNYGDKLPGMLNWTMSYEGLYVMNDEAVEILENRFNNRKPVFIRQEYPDGSYRTGWASVTTLDEDHSYSGVSTLKVTLEGKGAISDIQKLSAVPNLGASTSTVSKAALNDISIAITPAEANVRSVIMADGTKLYQETDYTYSQGALKLLKTGALKDHIVVGDNLITITITADVKLTYKLKVTA